MVTIPELWLPILASAALVFVASAIIHMLLPYHRTDYGPVPEEDRLLDDLRTADIPPGDYALPFASSPSQLNDPAYREKLTRGPVVFMTVAPPTGLSMGRNLSLWFVYCLVISIVSAYVVGRTLPPGAAYGDVFRFAGTVAFAGYALALWQMPIWYATSWSTAAKNTFDGFIYGLLTGGTFGWLWPS